MEGGAAGGNRGESASPHPLRDLDDDDDIMILEPLVVTPLTMAPPAAGHVLPGRKRKAAAGSAIKFSKGRGSSTPAGTMSPPPPPPRTRMEPTPMPTSFPLPSALPGASSSAPPTVGTGSSSQGESARQTAPQPATKVKPAIKAPQPAPRKPADSAVADAKAKAKLKAKVVPPEQQLSLHVSLAAHQLATATSSADSDTDQNEVTSREGKVGMASMELFFSDMRALLTTLSKESVSRLNRMEKAVMPVSDRRTTLYAKVVASYHKAKTDARPWRGNWKLPKCTQNQEVAKGLVAKVKALEEELERLRKREAEHQAELASVKKVEQEKVDGLNRKQGEVDEKCQRLSSEVTKQSSLLTETA
ncbi:hypothetical protein ACQ4PT_070116 [Festuca glaucescens]